MEGPRLSGILLETLPQRWQKQNTDDARLIAIVTKLSCGFGNSSQNRVRAYVSLQPAAISDLMTNVIRQFEIKIN